MSPRGAPPRSLVERLDDWIFGSYPVSLEQLAAYRVVYAAFGLLVIGLPSYTWIAELPDAFFRPPPSIAAAFSGFPPAAVLQAFGIALVLLYFALLFGCFTRTVSVLIALVAFSAESFAFSDGKIDHARHAFFLLPLVMSFSDWGGAFSIDASRRGRSSAGEVERWPITLMSLLLGFGFFTSGWSKLVGGWLDVTTPAVREKVFHWYFSEGMGPRVGFFVGVESPVLWELLDWFTVLFQLGFLAAVLRPAIFRFFTGIAVVFHTLTLVMLNIGFTPQLIVYLLFCMPRVAVSGRFAWAERLFRPWLAVLLAAAYLGLADAGLPVTALGVVPYLLSPFLASPYFAATLGLHFVALGVGLWMAVGAGRRIWARYRSGGEACGAPT